MLAPVLHQVHGGGILAVIMHHTFHSAGPFHCAGPFHHVGLSYYRGFFFVNFSACAKFTNVKFYACAKIDVARFPKTSIQWNLTNPNSLGPDLVQMSEIFRLMKQYI